CRSTLLLRHPDWTTSFSSLCPLSLHDALPIFHPTCIPVAGEYQSKLTLMSESLRNDGRIWVPKRAEDCDKDPREIPEEDRDYYLERKYPSFGNLVPRDIASRQAKVVCDEGRGVGPKVGDFRRGVYLDFASAIERLGEDAIR